MGGKHHRDAADRDKRKIAANAPHENPAEAEAPDAAAVGREHEAESEAGRTELVEAAALSACEETAEADGLEAAADTPVKEAAEPEAPEAFAEHAADKPAEAEAREAVTEQAADEPAGAEGLQIAAENAAEEPAEPEAISAAGESPGELRLEAEVTETAAEAPRPVAAEAEAEGREVASEAVCTWGTAAERTPGAGLPRLPTIDDFDWEQHIGELARRLAPHQESVSDEAADERETLDRPVAVKRPERGRQRKIVSAAPCPDPHAVSWPEPSTSPPPPYQARRDRKVAIAASTPVLAAFIFVPFIAGMPDAWAERVGWFLGDRSQERVELAVRPAPGVQSAAQPAGAEAQADEADAATESAVENLGPAFRYPLLAAPSAPQVEGLVFSAARDHPSPLAPALEQESAALGPRPTAAEAGDRGLTPNASRPVALPEPLEEDQPQPGAAGSDDTPASAPPAQAEESQPQARRLTSEEIEALLTRGHRLLELGDIASARLLFRRVADAGDPRGAKAMGMTFDPSVFADLPVAGVAHDRAQAELWYDRSDAMPAAPAAADEEM